METSQRSQLPTYDFVDTYVTPVGDGTKAKVAEMRCPRSGCKLIFIILVSKWWHPSRSVESAACPYCFKAAWRGCKPR